MTYRRGSAVITSVGPQQRRAPLRPTYQFSAGDAETVLPPVIVMIDGSTAHQARLSNADLPPARFAGERESVSGIQLGAAVFAVVHLSPKYIGQRHLTDGSAAARPGVGQGGAGGRMC